MGKKRSKNRGKTGAKPHQVSLQASSPLNQPSPTIVPALPKIHRLRFWVASSWIALLLVITYLLAALWLYLMAGPEWSNLKIVRFVSAMVVVLGPLSPILAILLLDHLRARVEFYIQHVLRPTIFVVTSVVLFTLGAALAMDIFIRLLSFHDALPLAMAASEATQWEEIHIKNEFIDFDGGALANSPRHDIYFAYVYSLAARQSWEGQHENEEKTLYNLTGFGQPVLLRIIGHMGLANLCKSTDSTSEALDHLRAAQSLAEWFAPTFFYKQLLSEVGLLDIRLVQIAKTEDEKTQLLNDAETAYLKLDSLSLNDSIVDRVSCSARRADVIAMRGDWVAAIRDWNEGIDLMLTVPDVPSKRGGDWNAVIGDCYNNEGVASMMIGLWADALTEIKKAEKYKGGDDRRTQLNELICDVRLGLRKQAQELSAELEPGTERGADYVLLGWAQTGNNSLTEYAKAIEVSKLTVSDLTPAVRKRLADLCNKEYIGFTFQADDFAIVH